jgi:hypothetical protein
MEHAPLRPVPARPAGPIDPATALREVGSWLPALDPDAARALALVVLAERTRAEAAASLGVSEDRLGTLLAAARKELRQTVVTLAGSGWCERAEALISDRLDGSLPGRDVRRLDVHLRNCSRCVEHERRLVQATDALVGGLGGRPSPTSQAPVPLVEAPPADGTEEEPAAQESTSAAPEDAPAAEERAPAAEEGAPVPEPGAPVPAAGLPAPPSPSEGQIAAAAEVLVTKRTRGQIAAAVVWNSMIAIAILLALVTIAVTIVGITGGSL